MSHRPEPKKKEKIRHHRGSADENRKVRNNKMLLYDTPPYAFNCHVFDSA